jgi:hypothetical protein
MCLNKINPHRHHALVRVFCIACGLITQRAGAASPSTAPTTTPAARDESMDWLMSQSATAPSSAPSDVASATQPSSQPSPLTSKNTADAGSRPGTIEMSDGRKFHGNLSTTLGKPLRVFDPETSEFRDVPFALVRTIEASILWEREQEEWHFKASGSDIKEFSGKTYPARETAYTFTLTNGKQVSGSIAAPIYADLPDGARTFVLYKRDKGPVGEKLAQLTYVKRIEFDK